MEREIVLNCGLTMAVDRARCVVGRGQWRSMCQSRVRHWTAADSSPSSETANTRSLHTTSLTCPHRSNRIN